MMDTEFSGANILLAPYSDGYRVLHGHLHLANALSMASEVFVDVKGEGQVKIVKTSSGFLVTKDSQRIPLF